MSSKFEQFQGIEDDVLAAFDRDVKRGLDGDDKAKNSDRVKNSTAKNEDTAKDQPIVTADGVIRNTKNLTADAQTASKYASRLSYGKGGDKYAQTEYAQSTVTNSGEKANSKKNKKNTSEVSLKVDRLKKEIAAHEKEQGFVSGRRSDQLERLMIEKRKKILAIEQKQQSKEGKIPKNDDAEVAVDAEMEKVRQAIDAAPEDAPDDVAMVSASNNPSFNEPQEAQGNEKKSLGDLRTQLQENDQARDQLIAQKNGFRGWFKNKKAIDDQIAILDERHNDLTNEITKNEPIPERELVSKNLRDLSDALDASRREYLLRDNVMDTNSSKFKRFFGVGNRSSEGAYTEQFEDAEYKYKQDLKNYYDAIVAEELDVIDTESLNKLDPEKQKEALKSMEDDRRIIANGLNVGELASLASLRNDKEIENYTVKEKLREGYIKMVERYNRLPMHQKIIIGAAFIGVGGMAAGVGTAAVAAGGALTARRVFGLSAATVGFKSMFEGIADNQRMKNASNEATGFANQVYTEKGMATEGRAQQIESFVDNHIGTLDKKFQDNKDWQKRRWLMAGAAALTTFGAARCIVGWIGGGTSVEDTAAKPPELPKVPATGVVSPPIESMGIDRPDAYADEPYSYEDDPNNTTDNTPKDAEISEKEPVVSTEPESATPESAVESPAEAGDDPSTSEPDTDPKPDDEPLPDAEPSDSEPVKEPADTEASAGTADSEPMAVEPESGYFPSYEVKKGDTLWGIFDTVFEKSAETGSVLADFNEGQKTIFLDSIKDKFGALSPEELREKVGFSSGNIDKIVPGDKLHLTEYLSKHGPNPSWFQEALTAAVNLSDAGAEQITQNNAIIEDFAAKNPDVMLTEEKIDEILKNNAGSGTSTATEVTPAVESVATAPSSEMGEMMTIEKGSSIEGSIIDYLESHGMDSRSAGREAHLMALDFADKAGVKMSALDLVHPGDKIGIVPDPDRAGGFIMGGLHADGGRSIVLEGATTPDTSATAAEVAHPSSSPDTGGSSAAAPESTVDTQPEESSATDTASATDAEKAPESIDPEVAEVATEYEKSHTQLQAEMTELTERIRENQDFIDNNNGSHSEESVNNTRKIIGHLKGMLVDTQQEINSLEEAYNENGVATENQTGQGSEMIGTSENDVAAPENLPVENKTDAWLENMKTELEKAQKLQAQFHANIEEALNTMNGESASAADVATEDAASVEQGDASGVVGDQSSQQTEVIDESGDSDGEEVPTVEETAPMQEQGSTEESDLGLDDQKAMENDGLIRDDVDLSKTPEEYYDTLSAEEQASIDKNSVEKMDELFSDHDAIAQKPAANLAELKNSEGLTREQFNAYTSYYVSAIQEYGRVITPLKGETIGEFVKNVETMRL